MQIAHDIVFEVGINQAQSPASLIADFLSCNSALSFLILPSNLFRRIAFRWIANCASTLASCLSKYSCSWACRASSPLLSPSPSPSMAHPHYRLLLPPQLLAKQEGLRQVYTTASQHLLTFASLPPDSLQGQHPHLDQKRPLCHYCVCSQNNFIIHVFLSVFLLRGFFLFSLVTPFTSLTRKSSTTRIRIKHLPYCARCLLLAHPPPTASPQHLQQTRL